MQKRDYRITLALLQPPKGTAESAKRNATILFMFTLVLLAVLVFTHWPSALVLTAGFFLGGMATMQQLYSYRVETPRAGMSIRELDPSNPQDAPVIERIRQAQEREAKAAGEQFYRAAFEAMRRHGRDD